MGIRSDKPAPCARTIIVYVPAGTTLMLCRLMVVTPSPGAGMLSREKDAETVLGRPDVLKLTGLLNAPRCEDVRTSVPDAPC